MEEQNNTQNLSKNQYKSHKIICENKKYLCITGVQKADNASPTLFSCIVLGTQLTITGRDMSVKKLDTTEGIVEIVGEIDEIKYSGERKSFLKRLFK